MPDFLAAIDQGTTGTRCILFDREGRPAASGFPVGRMLMQRQSSRVSWRLDIGPGGGAGAAGCGNPAM